MPIQTQEGVINHRARPRQDQKKQIRPAFPDLWLFVGFCQRFESFCNAQFGRGFVLEFRICSTFSGVLCRHLSWKQTCENQTRTIYQGILKTDSGVRIYFCWTPGILVAFSTNSSNHLDQMWNPMWNSTPAPHLPQSTPHITKLTNWCAVVLVNYYIVFVVDSKQKCATTGATINKWAFEDPAYIFFFFLYIYN